MNLVIILMVSAKVATPGLLKGTVFWNKWYDVIIFVNDVVKKILSRDSNYIVDVFMWQSLVTIAFLWEKLSQPQSKKDLTRKAAFNNLGLTLGTNLKFYTSAAKELKLKVKRFWWLIPTFVEVTGEKLVDGAFLALPPSWIGSKLPVVFTTRLKQDYSTYLKWS